MSLINLYNNGQYYKCSDKNTVHSYVQGYYTHEFKNPERVERILEIGIWTGGSMLLWSDWFPNAQVIGFDNNPHAIDQAEKTRKKWYKDNDYSRVLMRLRDAYTLDTVARVEDDSCDYIIDDGPHTLDSMKYAIKHYLKKVKPGGKLIIEDVQSISWFDELEDVSEEVKDLVKECKRVVLDTDYRYDDLIFEITRK